MLGAVMIPGPQPNMYWVLYGNDLVGQATGLLADLKMVRCLLSYIMLFKLTVKPRANTRNCLPE